MTTGKLLKCYDRSRNTMFLTNYPMWFKKNYRILVMVLYVIYSAIIILTNAHWILALILTLTFGVYVIYFRVFKITKLLRAKYQEIYNIRIGKDDVWTEEMTYRVRKIRLKNCIGKHIENEALMTRIKAQLNDEIMRNKRTIQSPIPIMGLVTVFIAAYITFNLKYLETKFGKLNEEMYSTGKYFLANTALLVVMPIILILISKQNLDAFVNRHSLKLGDLLRTIQTIEIEYLATKTNNIGAEVSNKTMD